MRLLCTAFRCSGSAPGSSSNPSVGAEERQALERFYAAVRKATPQVRALAGRYRGDVSFSFDSNGRSVWVIALFGKGAPPTLRTVSDREVPWIPMDDEQEEDGNEEEGED